MNAAAVTPTPGAAPSASKGLLWTGRVLSALPVLAMVLSGAMKVSHAPQLVDKLVGTFGYPESAVTGIGLLEIACAIVYVIPRASVLGAVLVTGYLGGAVATHVRLGDPSFVGPLVLGIIAWAGLFLRDDRIRALLPLRAPRK
jgi:hypothetical protein